MEDAKIILKITIDLKKLVDLLNTTKDDHVKSVIYTLVNDELNNNDRLKLDYQDKFIIVDNNWKEVQLWKEK